MRRTAMAPVAAMALAALVAGCGPGFGRSRRGWRQKLDAALPLYGHRNWVCVVDSAYPAQANPSLTTIATGEPHLQTLKTVLAAIEASPHVRPLIYLDAELPHVPEADAPGITAYRADLDRLLAGREVRPLPHEEIIAKLDEAGKLFRILILKTNLALPYTSVFLQLDCGYWSAEAQKRLEEAVGKAK